ncbi:hypothetical protein, partial [Paenibacillus peoriae]|uniref:hypothetical protein n=1 Tax=Paenibacillus peoriae TaxID=59893 RepID=UPI003D2A5243
SNKDQPKLVIERAISSFLMLAILLYKRRNLYFHHPFVQFSKNLSVLDCSTSQELDHIMLVTFLSNLFLIFFQQPQL